MDLYCSPTSPPCRAVMMAAKAIGIELNLKPINLFTGEHMSPEYGIINPQHIIPTLNDNGFILWESRAILIYLVEKYAKTDALYPRDVKTRALINQRLYFDMGTMFQTFLDYYTTLIRRKGPADPEKYKQIDVAFEMFNKLLQGCRFVVGDSLTIADLSLLATVSTYESVGFDFSKYKQVMVWYEHLKLVAPGWKENWDGVMELKNIYEK